MSSAVSGFGTLLKVSDGGGTPVFTTIAEVKTVDSPELTTETADVTHMTSPSAIKEFIATLSDNGEISFTANAILSHATQGNTAGLYYLQRTRTMREFQLVFPFAVPITWTQLCLVTKLKTSTPIDGAMTLEGTLKVSGAPVWS